MSDGKSLKDELRSATLGSEAEQGAKLVEWKGKQYELRLPTFAQQKFIERASKDKKTGEVDRYRAGILTLIECVYVPGTDERVFDATDADALMGRRDSDFTGHFISQLGKMQKAVSEEPDEAIEKN